MNIYIPFPKITVRGIARTVVGAAFLVAIGYLVSLSPLMNIRIPERITPGDVVFVLIVCVLVAFVVLCLAVVFILLALGLIRAGEFVLGLDKRSDPK